MREARLLAALATPNEDGTPKVIDPAAAAKLITGVEFDQAGNPTNVQERLDALKASSPLFAQPPQQAAPAPPAINGRAGQQPQPAPTLTVDEAAHCQDIGMDPAYFAQLKALGDAPNQFEAWQQLQKARQATGATQ